MTYSVRVMPYLKREYFEDDKRNLFTAIGSFVKKYKKLPTEDEFSIFITDMSYPDNVKEAMLSFLPQIFKKISGDEKLDFLIDTTEEWCQQQAAINGVLKCVEIVDGTDKKTPRSAIVQIMRDATSVAFNSDIGHEYFDAAKRYDLLTQKAMKIPFGIDILDKITNGGFETKSLCMFMAGTHVGKTLALCDLAAKQLIAGEQVLYISLETREEKIAQRIDANLLKVDVNDIPNLPRQQYIDSIQKLRGKNDLIVKEFPNGTVHAGHFRALLDELERKKNFKPRIVCIDYLNLCASELIKDRGNSYGYFKSVAEELRAIAMERDICIWTATQLNREGYSSSDPGLANTSESFGVPMTADFTMVMWQDDALKQLDQYMCKQEKNRFGNVGDDTRFTLGVSKNQMRLYSVQQSLYTP